MTDSTHRLEQKTAKEILNHLIFDDNEDAYRDALCRFHRKSDTKEDVQTLHALLRACLGGDRQCTTDEFISWTRFISSICTKEKIAEKSWGSDIQHLEAALKAVLFRITDSTKAMEIISRLHKGDINALMQDTDGLGKEVLKSCVDAGNWDFLTWMTRVTGSKVWNPASLYDLVIESAPAETCLGALMALRPSRQREVSLSIDPIELEDTLDEEASQHLVRDDSEFDIPDRQQPFEVDMEESPEDPNCHISDAVSGNDVIMITSQDPEETQTQSEVDEILDLSVEAIAAEQNPSRTLITGEIATILARHRIETGNKERIGHPLQEKTFNMYVSSLAQIPSTIFPCSPMETMQWLKDRFNTDHSVLTQLNRICVFLRCMQKRDSDAENLRALKDLEQKELFGGLEAFTSAFGIFRHEQLEMINEEKQRGKHESYLSKRQSELWVNEDDIRDAYKRRCHDVRALKDEIVGRLELNERTKEQAILLQEQAILELYLEPEAPLRSEEFQTMQFNPPLIESNTNYVDDGDLVINKDKTSSTYGPHRVRMSPQLRETIELLIKCRNADGESSGFVFQRQQGGQLSPSAFTKATRLALFRLVGKRLGCGMLRKIVQTGKTERGELRWPKERQAFHRASRHSAAVADAHYVIPQAVDKRPQVRVESDEQSANSGGAKRARITWSDACRDWFKKHVDDMAYRGLADDYHDWEKMASDMNAACGSTMIARNLSNRFKNRNK